ncbi:salicylate hydroxylase [Cognatiyoonia koreensis]|uniref:Salicylate hydroxylase n=1 Tax=Cognatiyoonia koreensis TaxID=364200 RepID=A0A1I0NVQ7_9RHOB|nr:FAD-dependent monooxygenase [Cognatiyoonia koreensis]SEW05774.1 salicylate hydroxylase [Cognatiyoonia koreensis]
MRNVAIIGGGIGGLTAALAFAANGASVTVYEQAPVLSEIGAGLQITPNGMRVLQALNLGAAMESVGVAAEAVVPTDGLTGRAITRFDLARRRPRYRFVHRADLIRVLEEACKRVGVTVQLGTRIADVGADGRFTVDGVRKDPDLTIGADGLHSIARPVLNGMGKPFFTRQVAWRAVVEHVAKPEARIWMLPGAHVVTYPLRGSRLNIVAVQERDAWAQEGWHHDDAPANLASAFANSCRELRDILGQVDAVKLWGLFRHPVAEIWADEGLALIGDAAHPTLPFLAQGANLAIEDAYVLAQCCASGELEHGLASYQKRRKERVRRAINTANANAVNYHLRGPRRAVSHLVLKGIGKAAPDAFLNRLSWLYDHDVTASSGSPRV